MLDLDVAILQAVERLTLSAVQSYPAWQVGGDADGKKRADWLTKWIHSADGSPCGTLQAALLAARLHATHAVEEGMRVVRLASRGIRRASVSGRGGRKAKSQAARAENAYRDIHRLDLLLDELNSRMRALIKTLRLRGEQARLLQQAQSQKGEQKKRSLSRLLHAVQAFLFEDLRTRDTLSALQGANYRSFGLFMGCRCVTTTQRSRWAREAHR